MRVYTSSGFMSRHKWLMTSQPPEHAKIGMCFKTLSDRRHKKSLRVNTASGANWLWPFFNLDYRSILLKHIRFWRKTNSHHKNTVSEGKKNRKITMSTQHSASSCILTCTQRTHHICVCTLHCTVGV